MGKLSKRAQEFVIGGVLILGVVLVDSAVMRTLLNPATENLLIRLPARAGWFFFMLATCFAYYFVTESDYPAIIRSSGFLRAQMRFSYAAQAVVAIIFFGVSPHPWYPLAAVALTLLPLGATIHLVRYWLAINKAL